MDKANKGGKNFPVSSLSSQVGENSMDSGLRSVSAQSMPLSGGLFSVVHLLGSELDRQGTGGDEQASDMDEHEMTTEHK